MIIVTLLIIPALTLEFFGEDWLQTSPSLAFATHALTALIWLGFATEFILLISASPDKAQFCIKHWVNLVIILLPLVAFLRFLRLLRFAKLARAYRLRSVSMRAWRLVLLFNILDRLHQRNPAKYIESLEKRIATAEAETAALRAKLAEFRAKHSPET
jgi:voltage-gated potassium channel